MFDDVPPVTHLSSDNEDEESTKSLSLKNPEIRQRGPPKKLSREDRAAVRSYAELGVPHKLLAERYKCSTHMVSRVVNNSFRIPDHEESDDDHFDMNLDKNPPRDADPWIEGYMQPRGYNKKTAKLEKKQPFKLVVRGQSTSGSASVSMMVPVSTSHVSTMAQQTSISEPSSPVNYSLKSNSPLSLPPETSSAAHTAATPLTQLGVKRKRDETGSPWQTSPPLDDHSHQGEKQVKLNGSQPYPLAAPPTPMVGNNIQPSRETPKPQLNGRIEELERSSSSKIPHLSDGTPSSASVSRYTLVPTTAEDFLLPPEPPLTASQLSQTEDGDGVDEPMDEDDAVLPSSLTQLISQAHGQGHRQRKVHSHSQKTISSPSSTPSSPLSEVEAFLKALKPDLSSLLPTFCELGIQSAEYLDGLRSIPRAENKEWFDELTSKGLFTPFQAHVILRALYK